MATARELTPDEVARYRATAWQRHRAEQAALARRERHARELARQSAALLRDRFGTERVLMFGSLIHPDCCTAWSDVDIAAVGIRPGDAFRHVVRNVYAFERDADRIDRLAEALGSALRRAGGELRAFAALLEDLAGG